MNPVVKNAFRNAVGMAGYVVLIASFFFYAPHLFGDSKTVLIPIVMLLLLVFSAALSGALVFGQPILWYLDGKKKEALSLLISTLGIILVIIIAAMVGLYVVR